MSDQTLPPSPPPTPPNEGVSLGKGAEAGTTTTPPPPPPADTAVGDAPPPLPPKKSRTGLIVGLVAGLVVLAIIAVVAVVLVVGKGEEKHSIAIPATAGGMKRDKGKETDLKAQLASAESQFKLQFKGVSYVKSGVYDQTDSKRGPEGELVFFGAKVKAAEKNPETFVENFTKQATTNGFKIEKISAGEGGGKAVCASQATGQKVAICAWATKDSGGELIPTVPGWDSKQLSKILIDMRPDVEKTE